MKLVANSLDDLELLAKHLVSLFGEHKVIAFYGEMGAGKTTLIKSICKALGSKDTVSSPTFSLVNEYKYGDEKHIYHFDFYRLNKETEALDMGCEEYFYSGNYCFIEWPEKIKNLLPADCLSIVLQVNDREREISLKLE
ncbi:MAG TPA: tRNA (adenosine(37)-N6)-threonylcarbamoyltransferase complex ATPase subunit type 1 TsaE [Bacteroidia bacterium]|nr:tRNA (adenosine(37)-N6)-threonylcarbamoyltransferase complex ATPase subunit type 1 TsaE [Bacteroidia bacterium]HRH08331.1 tRNA (adenosine(37)-N6)-threonylcarbamoyltransferase complex ATPase subunit type 1 TsaE [Bacteroidia bacterium]HRH63338.1 tRNA (adenosine(37)-N6)-threonylcarbamoyltransferase complex ATPase subunit type 1 TsaE [Bacteroidia bacterium]